MPKLKTKSGAKKRFRLTGTGKIRFNRAYKQHNLRKRSQKMKRQSRRGANMSKADAAFVSRFIPYA